MGSSQSRSAQDNEKVFHSETPISFSQDVVNQLADHAANPATSPERQSSLDDHIRSRIQSELEHLRKDEDDVRKQIELALEKENLDRERTMAGGASEGDGASLAAVKSSVTLMGDLEEIRSKVDRFHSRRDLSEFPQVKADGEAVVLCYRANPATPLDCWEEVNRFKASVAKLEQGHLKTLQ